MFLSELVEEISYELASVRTTVQSQKSKISRNKEVTVVYASREENSLGFSSQASS